MGNLAPTVLYSAMAGIAMFACFEALRNPSLRRDQRRYLVGLLALVLIHTLGELLIVSGAFRFVPQLVGAQLPLRTLLGPLFWFYARSMMSPAPVRLYGYDALALIGPVAVLLVMLPYAALDASEKLALADPVTRDPELYRLALATSAATTLIFLAVTLAYLGASVRMERFHRRRLKDRFSNLEKRSLRWLAVGNAIWAAVWSLFGLREMLWFTENLPDGADVPIAIVQTLALSGFAHLALHQPPIEHPASRESAAGRPRDAFLSEEQMSRIAHKLKGAMAGQDLYKDSDLSLRRLSDVVRISENRISETFSQHLRTNFYDFVNSFRIEEAKRLLAGSDTTILAITYETGFNSRSTFNAAFKRIVGSTPSAYRAAVGREGVDRAPMIADSH